MKKINDVDWETKMGKVGVLLPTGFYGLVGMLNFRDTQLPYNEERDRWSLQVVEPGTPANPTSQPKKLESIAATSQQVPDIKPKRRVSWLKLFGQKA